MLKFQTTLKDSHHLKLMLTDTQIYLGKIIGGITLILKGATDAVKIKVNLRRGVRHMRLTVRTYRKGTLWR